jgi:hypothetical protein
MEPETSIARQRLGKQVPAEMDTQATIEELLDTIFLFGPCEMAIKEEI